ncbi:GlsB/YeaQ/YmgE family stress response membrane protein [Rathayibacter rathayi]|nr:GlsB/YeaQ/YmgE family stress response membrane protein [Rathayibacter rathayi]
MPLARTTRRGKRPQVASRGRNRPAGPRPHYGRMTIVLGIIGSFVGGFPGFLIFQHDPMAAGIMGSIVGAIIVLLVYTRFAGRSTARR